MPFTFYCYFFAGAFVLLLNYCCLGEQLDIAPLHPFSVAPSSVKSSEIEKYQLDGRYYSPCSHWLVVACLDVLYNYRCPFARDPAYIELVNNCSDDIVHAVAPTKTSNSAFGYLSYQNCEAMAEDGITAWFVANFQQLLIQHQLLMEESVDNRVKVLHQAHGFNHQTKRDKKHSGYVDCSIFYDFKSHEIKLDVVKDKSCVFPMVFMEFTKNSKQVVKEKQTQSSLYANYIFRQMHADIPIGLPPLLGITMSETQYIMKLYYLTENKKHGRKEIAEILLQDGVFDGEFIVRMVGLVWNFIGLIKNHLVSTMEGVSSTAAKVTGSGLKTIRNILRPSQNVLLHENYVYKSYDYRNRIELVEAYRRDHRMYRFARFNVQTIVDHENRDQSSSSLHIIKYPYIEGSSSPSHVIHFYDIVCELRNLHEQRIVFGDVRLANMVFKPLTVDTFNGGMMPDLTSQRGKDDYSSCFIDFDYARVAGEGVYPPKYNINVPDGPRHDEARALEPLQTIHDCFSLGSIMGYFCLDHDPSLEHATLWTDIVTTVMKGDLADAIYLFDYLPNYPLKCKEVKIAQMVENLAKNSGTGSPPPKKK